jgi:DNA-binding MarR family transcriptional regulator
MSTLDVLRRLIAQSIAMHEVVAASLGINVTDLRCLELLQEQPAITPSRLAELAGLTSGAVTGVLDRLEAAGFVRRESDPEDRRRIIVRPATERMADVNAAYEPLVRAVAQLGATPEAAAHLDRLVDLLAGETDRLRVATQGGLIGNLYVAPMEDVSRARLHLRTGAPRLNWSGSKFGQQVRMVAETAATRLRLRPGSPRGELIRVTFVGPPAAVRSSGGSVRMRYRRRMLDTRAREIDALLNPSATWSLDVEGGITDVDGDLREIPVGGVEIRGGVNHLRLQLPRPSGTVRIGLEGGSSDIRISRPAGVPVAVMARNGVADLRLDEQRTKASATELRLETARYDRQPDRYLLELAGGVERLVVREA